MLKTRFAIFLTPLMVYLLWLLAKLLFRRRPTRFEVSVGLSILLLVYFLAVVGTGIFWVAAQELPVFDWHYLPGYLLLLTALAHVVLHWNSVATFIRRRSPARMVEPDGQRFKGLVRWTGYGLAGFLGAGVFLFIGTKFASKKFTCAGQGDQISAAGMSAVKEGEPIPSKFLKANPVTMSLARLYHEGCSYPNRFNLPGITIQGRPAVYKDYPNQPVVPLPDPKTESPMSVLQAYQAWISGQGKDVTSLTLTDLSKLLYFSQGVSDTIQRPNFTFDLRTAASAGALYPVNLYVLAERVEGLEPGLYYYHPKQAALVRLPGTLRAAALAEASGSPDAIRSAPATILYSATYGRTAFKYGDRSYRYVTMDTGHAAYNLAICAATMGLRAPFTARFDDARVQSMLALRSEEEGTLLIQPLGAQAEPKDSEPRFLPMPNKDSKGTFLDLIHGGSSLQRGKTIGPRLAFPPADRPGKGRISLPTPARGGELFQTIRQRRSVRTYGGTRMPLDQLSALCAASTGYGTTPGFVDPFMASSAPLDLYLEVRDVEGLQSGIYRYHPSDHSLEQTKGGDFSKACMKAALQQEFCGTANVVFMKVIAWEDLSYPDGDRGYRYACLRAGLMGEGLYLQGTAMGLGVCGVGAFEDGAIAKILDLDPSREACLYLTAVGTR